MATLYITPNGDDDPNYFQVQEWINDLPGVMDNINNEFTNEVRLLTEWNANPIGILISNPMMDTQKYTEAADKLLQNGRYQYWVDN